MSALRTSANQQASPSFWSLRPADDLWVAAARERAAASEPLRAHCENIMRILCGAISNISYYTIFISIFIYCILILIIPD